MPQSTMHAELGLCAIVLLGFKILVNKSLTLSLSTVESGQRLRYELTSGLTRASSHQVCWTPFCIPELNGLDLKEQYCIANLLRHPLQLLAVCIGPWKHPCQRSHQETGRKCLRHLQGCGNEHNECSNTLGLCLRDWRIRLSRI